MGVLEALPDRFYVMRKKALGYTYFIKYDRNSWDAKTKRATKVNPVIIGKIMSGDGCGIIRFTPEYVQTHPILNTAAIERRFSPSTNKWEFKEVTLEQGHKIITTELPRVRDKVLAVRSIGSYLLYMRLLHGDPLLASLQHTFPEQWEKLLSLAFYCIDCANGCIALQYPRYSEDTKLPYQHSLSPKVITTLFQSISEAQVRSFFAEYTESLYTSAELGRRRFWAMDSTSISTYSSLIDAGYGKNKQEENLPQINVMMLTDQKSGRPLFYETFDGSIPDVKKAASTFNELLHLGAKSFVAVMDRGFYSLYNLDGIVNMGYHFLVCVPIDKVKLYKGAIVKANQAFLTGERYNNRIDQNVFTTEQIVKFQRDNKEHALKLYVHVFYDQERAGAETKAIQRRRAQLIKLLKEHVTLDGDNKKFADTYLIQNKDGGITLNNAAFQHACDQAGIFVVVSDVVHDGQTAFLAYRDRKVIEDGFRDLKKKLNCSRFFVSSDASLTGKCFVEFIALSLYMRISEVMRKAAARDELLAHHSVPTLLEDLKGIKAIYFNDGYVDIPTLSKKQTDALKLFGIKQPVSGYREEQALPNMIRYARKPHGDSIHA